MATAPPAATAHIRFRCPHCGKTNKAPTGMIGCGGTCARCKGGVKVPAMGDRTAGPVMREARTEKSVERVVAIPEMARSVRTLEALGELVAERREKKAEPAAAEKKPEKPKPRRTPWWLLVLHLSLPVATVIVLVSIYQARQTESKPSTAVVEETPDGQAVVADPMGAGMPTEKALPLTKTR